MNHVEQEALSKLADGAKPIVYARYVDDIIMGPYIHSATVHQNILDTFNAVNSHIQFTIEAPQAPMPLNYLDLQFKISGNILQYNWWQKPIHSGNTLRNDSHHPDHVKRNFVQNRFSTALSHASDQNSVTHGIQQMEKLLHKNGYTSKICRRALDYAKSNTRRNNSRQWINSTKLKLPYLGEAMNRKLHKALGKSPFNIKLISATGPQLVKAIQPARNSPKCTSCKVCPMMPKNLNCRAKFVVYRFTCTICSAIYVGQTSRRIITRYSEHERHVKNGNIQSALSEHLINLHANQPHSINLFQMSILHKSYNSKLCAISEAIHIKQLSPTINRKFERTQI